MNACQTYKSMGGVR